MDMNLSKLQEIVKDREARRVADRITKSQIWLTEEQQIHVKALTPDVRVVGGGLFGG